MVASKRELSFRAIRAVFALFFFLAAFPLSAGTDAEPADPAALFPTILRPVPAKYAENQRVWQGIPSIEAVSPDRVWIVWYSGGRDEGYENYLLVTTSGDGGRTWRSPFMALDREGAIRLFDPALWLDPLGRLWLFWAQGEGSTAPNPVGFQRTCDGRVGVWGMVTENPDAGEGAVWSAPRRLCDGVMMNKPIVDSRGRWLYPVSIWRVDEAKYFLPEEAYGANVYVSTDRGETLRRLGVPDGRALVSAIHEHSLVELADGRLWLLSRIPGGIGEAFSEDGGKTWSKMTKTPYKQSSSRTQTRRLVSGNILFLKNGPVEGRDGKDVGRSEITAFLSEDDGKTWVGGLVLDSRDKVSYPDFGQTPDGVIYATWDHDRFGEGEILFARFTEEDIRAGKFVSGKAIPATVVNRLEKSPR